MPTLRTPIRLNITSLLAKIETTYATDSVPTGAANAISLRGKPSFTPMEMNEESRELMRPYFGSSEMLPGTYFGKFSFQVEAAGSGTAGVAPAYGVLNRSCGHAEIVTAAPIAAVGQAGGGANGIKLVAGASSVDDFYNGMPITITSGTGNGQKGIIVDYDGTSKIATVVAATWIATDATSNYSIGANVVYKPASSAQESMSAYWNLDGVSHKFVGVRGNLGLNEELNKAPYYSYDYFGVFGSVSDAVVPPSIFTPWKRPLLVNAANTPLFTLLGNGTIGLESMNFDAGNVIEHHELVNLVEQFIETDRQSKAALSIEAVKVATQDWFNQIKNGTFGGFALTHGTAAGNIVTLSGGNVQLHKPDLGERGSVRMLKPELLFLPTTGDDEYAICVY